jgi:hypothetical protein
MTIREEMQKRVRRTSLYTAVVGVGGAAGMVHYPLRLMVEILVGWGLISIVIRLNAEVRTSGRKRRMTDSKVKVARRLLAGSTLPGMWRRISVSQLPRFIDGSRLRLHHRAIRKRGELGSPREWLVCMTRSRIENG